MKYFNIKNKGFTLVETLVAIAILMISIAGPLTIANKSLTAAVYARDQVEASFIAQEVVEKIKNDRLNGGRVIQAIDPYGDPCDGCVGVYLPKYTVSAIGSDGISGPDEYILKVTVSWNSGSIVNSFTLESHMFNTVL